MRKVFLDELPRKGTQRINWQESIGKRIEFIYDEITGYIDIIGYKERNMLKIKYNNKIADIKTDGLSKAKLGAILGVYTSEFKYEIGESFKDDKRNITIIDRFKKERTTLNKKIIDKMYVCKCNKCGGSITINESNISSQGCGICNGKIVVPGINSILDTHKWLVDDFGLDEDFAKTHTYGTRDKGLFVCKDCGNKKEVDTYSVVKGRSIGCSCGDGISYPEKFIMCLLKQLNIEFKTQLSKTELEWCDKYRYDFYIPEYNMIIETHGEQHYRDNSNFKVSLKEVQENDRIKKELALNNGIENYIVLDCRKSELEWIKNSIFNSKLIKYFDLSNIDWLRCEEFALKNIVKEVCLLKKNNPNMTTGEIGNIIDISYDNARAYLKKGAKLGWCDYNPKEELKKTWIKKGQVLNKGKEVEIFKDNKSLGIFKSCADLSRQSEKLFGVKLDGSNISAVCNGKFKTHKGFTFRYI